MEKIFTDWQDKHSRLYGKHTIGLKHRPHESPLFAEDELARLIDNYPRENYDICTMGNDHRHRQWREGEKGLLSGEEVIAAVGAGKIWINLRRVMDIDERYARLLGGIFGEIEEHTGDKSFKHNLGILISSPNAQVYYHSDMPGQSLWQIKGRKRVWVYPNSGPFLPDEDIGKIVTNEIEEDVLVYESWFDEYAEVIDLEPGMMAHWPHRVTNYDMLNISVTTEHWTRELRNAYAVNYANAMLRKVGFSDLGRSTRGIGFTAKLALAAAVKYSGLMKAREFERIIDFAVDPESPTGFVDIPSYQRRRNPVFHRLAPFPCTGAASAPKRRFFFALTENMVTMAQIYESDLMSEQTAEPELIGRTHWLVFGPSVVVAILYLVPLLILGVSGQGSGPIARICLLVVTVGVPILLIFAFLRYSTARIWRLPDGIRIEPGWPGFNTQDLRTASILSVEARTGLFGRRWGTGQIEVMTRDGRRFAIQNIAEVEHVASLISDESAPPLQA